MKRLISTFMVVALTATLALASALSFNVNDSGFDYTNTDTEVAYLALESVDGKLVLSLSNSATNSTLPAVAVTVPDLGKIDFWGNEIGAELNDISEIQLIGSLDYEGFSVTHTSAHVDTVIDSYITTLESLGLGEATVEKSTGSTQVITFDSNDGEVRAVFTQLGDDVTTYLYSN